jgi:group I intron endonuclease
MHAIYEIRNAVNGKVYIGSAMNATRRFVEHRRDLNRGKHGNRKLQHAWAKYGRDCFAFSVIEEVSDPSNLIRREQFWLDFKEAVSTGYNIAPTAGSLFGMKHSAETRKLMSAAHVGRRNSPEHVENTRAALTGRVMTDEQKQKMRDAKLGKKRGPHSAETKAKMSLASKGIAKSPAHIAKLSAAKLGKKQSPEHVAKRFAAARAARLDNMPLIAKPNPFPANAGVNL